MFSSQSDNIDWANLAQQWIQMQNGVVGVGGGGGGAEILDSMSSLTHITAAPLPPPSVSMQFPITATATGAAALNAFTAIGAAAAASSGALPIAKKPPLIVSEEKGEADMVMSDDEDVNVRNELKDSGHLLRRDEKHPLPTTAFRMPEENASVMQSMQQPTQQQWFMHQAALTSRINNASKDITASADGATNASAIAAWSAGWPVNMATSATALLPTTLQTGGGPNRTAHIPSLMKLSVPNPNNNNTTNNNNNNNNNNNSNNVVVVNSSAVNNIIPEEVVAPANMDAAKRKMLPAWIREGLEKMERSKQKEREQNNKVLPKLEHDNTVTAKAESSSSSLSSSTYNVTVTNNTVTHLATDDDSSGNEDNENDVDEHIDHDGHASIYRRKNTANISRHHASSSKAGSNRSASAVAKKFPTGGDHADDSDADLDDGIDAAAAIGNKDTASLDLIPASASAELTGKTYEKRLADLMIVVRRTLTELLLEVTNEEITQVANDAIKTYKTKASSTVSVMIGNSALSSITGKLGLAAYADTSSDEENSDNADSKDDDDASNGGFRKSTNKENATDSEEELKATIKSRHRAWAKISDEIEDHLSNLAEREEHQLKHYARVEQHRQRQDHAAAGADDGDDLGDDDDDDEPSGSNSTVGKSYERNFGETTETKLPHSNGNKRQKAYERKERTSRFTDNKDSPSLSAAKSSLTYVAQQMSQQQNQQHQQQQQQGAATKQVSPTLFPSTQAMENSHDAVHVKRSSTTGDTSSSRGKSKSSSKTSKSRSSKSVESSRRGKRDSKDREKDRRRRHHSSKRKHRSGSGGGGGGGGDAGRRKSHKHGSSLSTTASSSSRSSSTSSTSTDSSNDSDKSETSSTTNSRTSNNVRHKKRKRQRSKSGGSHRSEKDRSSSSRHATQQNSSSEYAKQLRASSTTSSATTATTRHEKSERGGDDYSKRSHHHRRHHHHDERRRHRRRHSSESDDRSRSRSRSRSSYASSSRHRHRR